MSCDYASCSYFVILRTLCLQLSVKYDSPNNSTPVPFNLEIPLISTSEPLALSLDIGESVFILGANGTGKSSLMQRIYSRNSAVAKRISAHRQTWFDSNAMDLSARQKQQFESSIQGNDTNLEARWKDTYAQQRASIAIYDLIDAENVRARQITRAADDKNFELVKTLSEKKESPVMIINRLLRLSDIPIEISVKEGAEVFASKGGSDPYSIAELSDGERNALLIAANVLTAASNQLIIIDEPERHLHRSIISPLLTHLFDERKDCAFIVSTHDVTLPFDNKNARTLLIRSCTYVESQVTAWDADMISPEAKIDDDIKKDILGARRKILFIEGIEDSLDKSLYSLIFPNVSIIPKSSCRDVEHAVSSIRNADEVHWLDVFGIVDGDRRSESEIEGLEEKGIYALSVSSVESIYYHPRIQTFIARAHAEVTGERQEDLLAKARSAAIDAVTAHSQTLITYAATQIVREEVFRHLPRRQAISAGAPIELKIDVEKVLGEERSRLEDLLSNDDIERVILQYPIKKTPALNKIATGLGFQGCEQYEKTVRKLLTDNPDALLFVKSLFNTLESALDS